MSITVTNRFQASQYLQRLPDEFSIYKIEVKSLQIQVLRRICRYIEFQFGLPEAFFFKSTTDNYVERIKNLLKEEFMETKDIAHTFVVLGNRKGILSGKSSIIPDTTEDLIDHERFEDNYPIFIDDSVSKIFHVHENLLKEENFIHSPMIDTNENETILKLKAALAQKEIDYDNEVAYWMAKCFSLEDEIHKIRYDKSQIIRVSIQAIRSYPEVFKSLKDRMIQAIPYEFVPVFRTKLQETAKLSKLYRHFEVILKMMDQFPDTSKSKIIYNEASLKALKQEKMKNWQEYANCYKCGRKGHLKKNCSEKKHKTNSRISDMDKKSQ